MLTTRSQSRIIGVVASRAADRLGRVAKATILCRTTVVSKRASPGHWAVSLHARWIAWCRLASRDCHVSSLLFRSVSRTRAACVPRKCESRERRISEQGAQTWAASTRGRWLEQLRVSHRDDRRDGDGCQARDRRDLRLPKLGRRPSRCRRRVAALPGIRASRTRDSSIAGFAIQTYRIQYYVLLFCLFVSSFFFISYSRTLYSYSFISTLKEFAHCIRNRIISRTR